MTTEEHRASGANSQASADRGAVFLSYASEDAAAAERIAAALRAGEIEVWFDKTETVERSTGTVPATGLPPPPLPERLGNPVTVHWIPQVTRALTAVNDPAASVRELRDRDRAVTGSQALVRRGCHRILPKWRTRRPRYPGRYS